MPRKDEPRVPVRLSDSDHATIKAAADSVNVGVAGLMRECSVRYAAVVAREIAAGNITLRRQRIETAAAVPGIVRASSLARDESDAGWARQQRVNALGRAKPKPAGRRLS